MPGVQGRLDRGFAVSSVAGIGHVRRYCWELPTRTRIPLAELAGGIAPRGSPDCEWLRGRGRFRARGTWKQSNNSSKAESAWGPARLSSPRAAIRDMSSCHRYLLVWSGPHQAMQPDRAKLKSVIPTDPVCPHCPLRRLLPPQVRWPADDLADTRKLPAESFSSKTIPEAHGISGHPIGSEGGKGFHILNVNCRS
jgi:hypothetical protein